MLQESHRPACTQVEHRYYRISQLNLLYGKCPKISNTKVSDKTPHANTAAPDQSAHSDQGLHCHSTKHFKKQLHKKQNLSQKKYGLKYSKF